MDKSTDEIKVIAHIRNGYVSKFGIPRQSGIASNTESEIVFEPGYRDVNAFRGIEEFSRLWIIWKFSDLNNGGSWSPTVRPPRLGGNERLGVFATRSPYRPNPIGLTCVKLVRTEHTSDGIVLVVSGADMMNGTPIYDIKPYIAYADSYPDAVGGFADRYKDYSLEVNIPEALARQLSDKERTEITELLMTDPRPSYQNDADRIYGVSYYDMNIKFRVADGVLSVTEIVRTV